MQVTVSGALWARTIDVVLRLLRGSALRRSCLRRPGLRRPTGRWLALRRAATTWLGSYRSSGKRLGNARIKLGSLIDLHGHVTRCSRMREPRRQKVNVLHDVDGEFVQRPVISSALVSHGRHTSTSASHLAHHD